MTNQMTGNAVVAFNRAADRTLTMAATFPTGEAQYSVGIMSQGFS